MEEIINKLIDIDNKAKLIIKEEIEKKNNFEEFVESEFNTKKAIFDLQYREEINKNKKKYDNMIENKKEQIENDIEIERLAIEKKYKEQEEKIVSNIINKIKKEG